MSLGKGILGYLSMKPLSGYDIKKLFNISAAYFWPADQAQIYRSLKELVEDGSIELKEYSYGETVNKKIYSITDKGREVLHDWLLSSNQSDFITRSTFLMKLFFSGILSIAEQLVFISLQLEQINGLLNKLRDNYNQNNVAYMETAGLSEDNRLWESGSYTHRWSIIKCKAYAQLLEEIKAEILTKKA